MGRPVKYARFETTVCPLSASEREPHLKRKEVNCEMVHFLDRERRAICGAHRP